jgi:hypothetical protein
MKTYIGYRISSPSIAGSDIPATVSVSVTVIVGKRRRPLNPCNNIRNHSPTGFEWGYSGSGPAQLALALVADCMGKRFAIAPIYQRVKAKVIAGLPHDGWTLDEQVLRDAVADAMREADMTEADLKH